MQKEEKMVTEIVKVIPKEFSLGEYAPTKQKEKEFQNLVEASSVLTITDFTDKEQIQAVADAEKNHRDLRVLTDKDLKVLRSGANKFRTNCIDISKKLIGIIKPEEERLKKLLDQVKIEKEKIKRKKDLPKRIEQLEEFEIFVPEDSKLLEMDDANFMIFLDAEKSKVTDAKQELISRILEMSQLKQLSLVIEQVEQSCLSMKNFESFIEAKKTQIADTEKAQLANDKNETTRKILNAKTLEELSEIKDDIEFGALVFEDFEETYNERFSKIEEEDKKSKELKDKEDALGEKQQEQADSLKKREDELAKKEQDQKDAEAKILHEKEQNISKLRVLEIKELEIVKFVEKSHYGWDQLGKLSDDEWAKEKQEALNQKAEREKKELEDKKKKDLDAKKEEASNKKLQEFLAKNDCTSDNKELFIVKYNKDRSEAYLWKKIDTLVL